MCLLQHRFEHFVETIGRRLTKPQRRFLRDMLQGILASRSLLLTEVARGLREPIPAPHVWRRLSKRLGCPYLRDGFVYDDYLALIARVIRAPLFERPLVAVDSSDIQKRRSRVLPHLGTVHDGSAKAARGLGLGPGWNYLAAELVGNSGCRLPLAMRLYSHKHPKFQSERNILAQILDSVERILPANALFLLDRGYDGRTFYTLFSERELSFVVRLKKGRNLWVAGERSTDARLLSELEAGETFRYRPPLTASRERRKDFWQRTIGWASQIQLQGYGKSGATLDRPSTEIYSYVALWSAKTQEPIRLLTTERVTDLPSARAVADAYLSRWAVEETHRFIKDQLHLENNLRTMSWRSLERSVLFAMLVYGFLALLFIEDPDYVERISPHFAAQGDMPGFPHYRLLRGASYYFNGMLPNLP